MDTAIRAGAVASEEQAHHQAKVLRTPQKIEQTHPRSNLWTGATSRRSMMTKRFWGVSGFYQKNPHGGLANGGLAQKAPVVPKGPFRGNFCSAPVAVRCGGIGRSAPKRPRQALERPQSASKRPDFLWPVSPRFCLKIFGA